MPARRLPARSAAAVATAGTLIVTSSCAASTPAAAGRTTAQAPSPTAATPTTSAPASAGTRLPLDQKTGDATQVITVVATTTSSTTAMVRAWRRTRDGWTLVGPGVQAYVGSDGLSRHPSESRSATPIGSFTITQAFGARSNPGTALPYRHTDLSDWWISQSGDLYNTRQRCATTAHTCAFNRGAPNEHLYVETPAYDYAAVIDYNTADAPGGIKQGAGSAFFLHVSEGEPTAGCVAVPRHALLRLLTWLTPTAHPRILIGV